MGNPRLKISLTVFITFIIILASGASVVGSQNTISESDNDDDSPSIIGLEIAGERDVVVERDVEFEVVFEGNVSETTLEYELEQAPRHTSPRDFFETDDEIDIENDTSSITFSEKIEIIPSMRAPPDKEREFEIRLELMDDDDETIDELDDTFYAGVFELTITPMGGVTAHSISSDEELENYIEGSFFTGASGWFVDEEIDMHISLQMTMVLADDTEEIVRRTYDELDPSEPSTLYVTFDLVDTTVLSFTTFVYGEIEEETKYGIGALKIGTGGSITAYGTDSFEYDYTYEFNMTLLFEMRPFVMYSGEDVLDSSQGTMMTGAQPSLYDYPSAFPEFQSWNSRVSLSHVSPIGNDDLEEEDGVFWGDGWVRLLPQPLVVGYDHLYTTPDTTMRLIGGGNLPSDMDVTIDDTDEKVFSASDSDVRNNNAGFELSLDEGEYTFVVESGVYYFEQSFYFYDGFPEERLVVNANSPGDSQVDIDVSDEIEESGWGVNSLDNTDNFEMVDDNTGKLEDVRAVVEEPGDDQASQTPYGSVKTDEGLNSFSHYKFAVCNVYRPYEFYAYILLGDSREIDRAGATGAEDYHEEDGHLSTTIQESVNDDLSLYSIYGEDTDLEKYESDTGLPREDIKEKADAKGYELFNIAPQFPMIDTQTDEFVYDDGDTAKVRINLDLDSIDYHDIDDGDLEVMFEIYDKDSDPRYDEPYEIKEVELDEHGNAEIEVEAIRGENHRIVAEGTDYLYVTAFEEVPIRVGGRFIFLSLLRGAGLVGMICVMLVFYKGFRSIYSDDEWKISGFLERFIRKGGT